jgi:DNA mismatch repair ATPase MutS
MSLKDIHNTLSRLGDGTTLDDIELFEVKHLAILSSQIRAMLTELNITAIELPQLDQVVEILDPDRLNIPSFYVYDSYCDELREVRKQMKALQAHGDELSDERRLELSVLLQRHADLELRVRERLSQQLQNYLAQLVDTLNNLAYLDILVSKAEQIKEKNLCFPHIVEDTHTLYNNMYHPAVKAHLAEQGKEFMPVNITFGNDPVTIIGANMGGKSVVLKSLALNQLLAQYGFGVAAQECSINPVEEIALCIGDEQSIVKGVSSFAAEIMAIDNVIKKIRAGKKILALIDEPARTTNPVEGTALVEGLLEVIDSTKGAFILTTHYNIENKSVKRYRVKGLRDGKMDYTLEVTHCGDVPHEAVAIAESLGIDPQWIAYTKKNLNN